MTPDQRAEQLRVPPHSIEAEQAVLGAVMLSAEAYDLVADLLDTDFYRRDHQLIWRSIQYMAERNRPFDAVTLGEWFQARGAEELVAGGAYFIELASSTPSAANVRAYAEIVREARLRRGMIDAGTKLVADAFARDGREATEVLSAGQAALGDLLKSQPCELEPAGTVLKRVAEDIRRRYETGAGEITGLPFEYEELNQVISGMQAGDLIVVAGRPAMGKTTLALNIAEHVAVAQQKRVAVHSLEMTAEQLMTRAICSIGRIEHDHVKRADLTDDDWGRFTTAFAVLKNAPLMISRPRSARVQQIIAQTQREHAANPLGLVVLDYLQLLDTAGAENKNVGIGEATRLLKLMAVNLGIPVIVLSQLSRECEKRTDKRPVLGDLRDSGSIEQDADVVICLYRDEVYNPASPDKGMTEVIVRKQRSGPPGTARLKSRLDICRFDPLGDWMPTAATNDDKDKSTPPRRGWRSRGGGGARAAGGD
ncbi:replicative DNA helicase [Pseudoxanthomonas indica]|uniref:Replicative DNA helicase n=1 Tax=Pseudoxanthomonas indica TaxID=428993 RepID=A0A1T5JD21_9GAMM|nr:replicative DNA helicase [Pseudoxanthomonas indica]GGD57976.1 replicative DNA helicase [Pseudoxanthomonas indica]SKC49244.1 replicative DNA helicase [Pseudoxanthomonas indica]